MCKACKMEPAEVKIHEQRLGALDPDDFYDETNYKPKRKKKFKRKPKGCAGNDNGAHVYVWTNENLSTWHSDFFECYGYSMWDFKVCVGCGRKDKTRLCDRYVREFGTKSYAHYSDPKFRKFHGLLT